LTAPATQTSASETSSNPNLRFLEEVSSATAGVARLEMCIQCGTCSGVCPLSIYMDYTPRQVMELVRSDFKNEVLQSHTIWLCASCYACTTECPRQIRITDIMYELKQRAIKEGVYPKRFPIPVLAEEFTKMVHDYGRISETWLVSKMYLRTNPLAAMGMAGLGMALMKTGRFSLKQDRIERREELAKIMEAVDQENGKAQA